ncbi:MAG: response regulator [Pseudomonadota bacterium]
MTRNILLVDDNVSLAYFTGRNLERDIEGIRVVIVKSCDEARREMGRRPFSVLVTDFQLPDGNGIDLADELRAKKLNIPIIVITGQHPAEMPPSGIFGLLSKPYEAQELVDLVQQALVWNRDHGADTPMVEPAPFECQGYDRHELQNKLAELLAGLRALGRDISSLTEGLPGTPQVLEDCLDDLCDTVMEVSRKLPKCPKSH